MYKDFVSTKGCLDNGLLSKQCAVLIVSAFPSKKPSFITSTHHTAQRTTNLQSSNPKRTTANMSTALPTMMPMQFLHQLPEAHDVTDEECRICLQKYVPTNAPPPRIINRLISMVGRGDPGPIKTEHPVRLPCQHVLGSECIKRWISPTEGGQNTCPYVSATSNSFPRLCS